MLTITSPGIDDVCRASHGAAVAVNDDTDNGLNFGPNPGGGHRELEPIFDLDHFEDTPKEDDLLPIKIDIKPNTVSGDVELKLAAGAADSIRIWPKKTKGKRADVIALPAKFPANTLPRELFVEGLKTGQVTLEVSFEATAGPATDKLVVNVVELVETQGGTRKILYDYNSAIQFKVNGAPANYTFEWDLDGDGVFNTATAEVGKTTDTATVKYGCGGGGHGAARSDRGEYPQDIPREGKDDGGPGAAGEGPDNRGGRRGDAGYPRGAEHQPGDGVAGGGLERGDPGPLRVE